MNASPQPDYFISKLWVHEGKRRGEPKFKEVNRDESINHIFWFNSPEFL